MFRLKVILYFLIGLLVVSCGGGTTTAKGDYSARIKLNFEQFGKVKDGTTARFQVGSTLVNSVVLDYGYNSQMNSVDVSSSAQYGGEVYIDHLEPGADYTFSVAAYGPTGDMVCLGGDTAKIVSGEVVDVNLVCTFKDKYAVQNKLFDVASKSMNGTLTSDEANNAVAGEFGMKDGMDRTAFINDIISANETEFPYSDVTLARVELVQRDRMATAKTAVDPDNTLLQTSSYLVKFIYSDGTYEFDDLNFIIEGSEWKLAGNGLKYGMKARHKTVEVLDENTPGTYYGIEPYRNSDAMSVAGALTVSGDSIEDVSFSSVYDPSTDDAFFRRDTPYDSGSGNVPEEINYSLVGYTGSVADGTTVTFDISEGSVVTHETYRIRGGFDSDNHGYDEKPVITPYWSGEKFSFLVQLPSWAVRSEYRYTLAGYSSVEQSNIVVHDEGLLALTNPSLIIDRAQYDGTEFMGGAFVFRYFDSNDSVYEVYMTYDYYSANALDGELPDNTYPAMGSGFGIEMSQDVDGVFSPLKVTNAYSYGAYYGIAMTAFNDLTTTDEVNYNPIVMKTVVSPKGQYVKGTIVRIPKYDKQLYNVKILWIMGADLIVGAGIKDTGKVVFMRISSDLSTIKWIKTYYNDTDDANSGSFVDMIYMNGSSELVAVMKGVKGGNQSTNLIKVSTTDGQVISAVSIASNVAGRYFAPVAVTVLKSNSKLLLLVNRTTTGAKSTSKIVALDTDFNIIGGCAPIINRNVTDLNMAIDDQYHHLYVSYTEQPDTGEKKGVIDRVSHTLSLTDGSITFDGVDRYEVVKTVETSPFTVSRSLMQISGSKLYYFFSGSVAGDMVQYFNTVMSFDIASTSLYWAKNMLLMTFDGLGPGPSSSLYGFYENKVANISSAGSMYGVPAEDADSMFGVLPSTAAADVSTDMFTTPFVPVVNGAADDTVVDTLVPVKIKNWMVNLTAN